MAFSLLVEKIKSAIQHITGAAPDRPLDTVGVIRNQLQSIAAEIEKSPDPKTFDENQMMDHYMNVMSWATYILRLAVSMAPIPDDDEISFTRDEAVFVGHMVRIAKLYDGFAQHVAKRQLEFSGIFMRLLGETEIKLRYLLHCRQDGTESSFVLASYKSEKQMLQYFESLEAHRELIPIELRMKRSIVREIEEAGITRNQLIENTRWNMDGLNIRSMLQRLGSEDSYPFLYGGASRWIHGGWGEFWRYHLIPQGNRYKPRLDYGDPDPRIPGPVTVSVLRVAKEYVEWAESDPDYVWGTIADLLIAHVEALDHAHEESL